MGTPAHDEPQRSKPKRSLQEGDVVTIQARDGKYMTAWKDEMTVTWKEELQGSKNPQFWTLVEKGSETSIEGYLFHLKSIYGTFLYGELNSDSNSFELCHKYGLSTKRYASITCSPWRLHDISPWQPPNGFRFFCDGDGYALCQIWGIQLVNIDKNAMLQDQQQPIGGHLECSQKSGKYMVVNFINQMNSNSRPGSTGGEGASGLPSVNTGQNVNGSGTQTTGDVKIENVVGKYENFYFQLT